MGNMNSGPRPKPTALKVLRGITRADRLNPTEPRPPDGEIVKPEGLSDGASKVWDELAPICLHMGTLTSADVLAFVTLCELQATFREAAAEKDGKRLMELQPASDEDGSPLKVIIDAVLKLERETATALRPFYDYFGLTPASRGRIHVPKKDEEPVSRWAGALK